MEKVITEASSLQCQHGGTITPKADAVSGLLTVEGKGVLTKSLVGSKVGTNCSQQTNTQTGSQQCGKVSTETPGASSVLTVGGEAVLLKSDSGTTDGSPTNNWSVKDAVQDVLSAD